MAYLTTKEYCRVFRLTGKNSVHYVDRLCRRGKLPATKRNGPKSAWLIWVDYDDEGRPIPPQSKKRPQEFLVSPPLCSYADPRRG